MGLSIFGPGIANGLVAGGPQLGAGAAVGTGLAAAGIGAAGVGLAAAGVGAASAAGGADRGSGAAARRSRGRRPAAYRTGGIGGHGGSGRLRCREPAAAPPRAWQSSFAAGDVP